MMTDGLYLDDATQRGGEGEVARKKQKGWKYFCFDNSLISEEKIKPETSSLMINLLDFNEPTSSANRQE